MININQTSEKSKIYIQRNITNDEPVINNYVTEDELQEILKEYNSIPYIVVDGFPDSLGFKITKGDWGAVHNAIHNNNPYLIYARSSTRGKIFSLVDDISPLPNGDVSIATTLIVANGKFTYRVWGIDINGNVELTLEETYTIQPKLVSGENIKTINGNDILGEGDIEIDVDLTGYATEQWVDDKGYLKEIPEEYVTETELNAKGYATTASVNNKQDKLTSGSNIKTINNASVLGSGNISVQPTLVSGTNIKTINGNSLLGSGDITIEGGGNGNIVELTQSEYNSITPEDDTLYVITDAPAVEIPDTENFVDKDTLTYEIDAINITINTKQDKLTSGTNIKTINGNSLLGSGNIIIEGGSTDLSNYYTKNEVDNIVGDIETILDNIIG